MGIHNRAPPMTEQFDHGTDPQSAFDDNSEVVRFENAVISNGFPQ